MHQLELTNSSLKQAASQWLITTAAVANIQVAKQYFLNSYQACYW